MPPPRSSKKTIDTLGETRLIRELSHLLPTNSSDLLLGIGDDTAVIRFGNKNLLFTTDALLENVHFDWRYTDPYLLGRKSLSVNLSDIAAMGGIPRWAVISLALPSKTSWHALRRFYEGLSACAKEFGVGMVGGDTDRSKGGWKITIAIIGEARHPICRSGAKAKDQIWVTGDLGASALALKLLSHASFFRKREDQKKKKPRAPVSNNEFLKTHFDPAPRVLEGQAISQQKLATSMTDVSDGLLLDLEHLCTESKVGAKIRADLIPLKKSHKDLAHSMKLNSLELALSGGEDYELLFTARPENHQKIKRTFEKLKTPVHCIGEMVSKPKSIQVIDKNGKRIEMNKKGYLHF